MSITSQKWFPPHSHHRIKPLIFKYFFDEWSCNCGIMRCTGLEVIGSFMHCHKWEAGQGKALSFKHTQHMSIDIFLFLSQHLVPNFTVRTRQMSIIDIQLLHITPTATSTRLYTLHLIFITMLHMAPITLVCTHNKHLLARNRVTD